MQGIIKVLIVVIVTCMYALEDDFLIADRKEKGVKQLSNNKFDIMQLILTVGSVMDNQISIFFTLR